MSKDDLRIQVNVGAFDDAPEAFLERAVRYTLQREKCASAEVSLTLLADDGIRELNRTYLGKDRPTDVIAFSLGEGDEVLGDIYVGADQAGRQAAAEGLPLEEELARLAVHGTLHVLGHDHPEGPDRSSSEMYLLQEEYLSGVLVDRERSA